MLSAFLRCSHVPAQRFLRLTMISPQKQVPHIRQGKGGLSVPTEVIHRPKLLAEEIRQGGVSRDFILSPIAHQITRRGRQAQKADDRANRVPVPGAPASARRGDGQRLTLLFKADILPRHKLQGIYAVDGRVRALLSLGPSRSCWARLSLRPLRSFWPRQSLRPSLPSGAGSSFRAGSAVFPRRPSRARFSLRPLLSGLSLFSRRPGRALRAGRSLHTALPAAGNHHGGQQLLPGVKPQLSILGVAKGIALPGQRLFPYIRRRRRGFPGGHTLQNHAQVGPDGGENHLPALLPIHSRPKPDAGYP